MKDWTFYLSSFCIFHLVALCFMLMLVKHNRVSNKLLAVFLFLVTYIHWQHIFLQTGFIRQFPYIDPIGGVVIALMGPLLLMYVRSLAGYALFHKNDWVHLFFIVPGIIHLINTLWWTPEEFDRFYYNGGELSVKNRLMLAYMAFYFLFYLGWCLWVIRRFSFNIKQTYSNIEKIKLDWLRNLLYILLACTLAISGFNVLVARPDLAIIVMIYISTAIYLVIVYKSMSRSVVFSDMSYLFDVPLSREIQPVKEKYAGNRLDETKLKEMSLVLEEYIKIHKPYLDMDLSLKTLSDALNIPLHQLSQFINQYYGKNFFDFVNAYRVDEFKSRIMAGQGEKFSLEGLAYECGFGSKAAFQRIFVKYTGLTPSEYRRSVLQLQE